MNTNNTDHQTVAANKITALLTGWGVPGSLARILVGALAGAIITAYSMLTTSCTPDARLAILTQLHDDTEAALAAHAALHSEAAADAEDTTTPAATTTND